MAKADPAERQFYLDEACGGDETLRHRLQVLLNAHAREGSILDRPMIDQFAAAPLSGLRDTEASVSAQPDPAGAREHGGDDEEIDLSFLQPSQDPGILGRLVHYGVMEVLGQGGFGIVLRAFDDRLHRVVAIKVLKPSLAATSPPRKRFLREARAAAAIHQENVITIYAVDDAPIPYLVMEYVQGRSLQQRLDETGPLDLPEVLELGRQIAEGLTAAHAKGLVHRDIKPMNVMLEDGTGRVKITDFGLARTVDDANLTHSGFIAGTPQYMSPEQALGGTVDQRSDLFSLGSVLYAACSGRPPFRAPTTLAVLKRVTEDTPRPIREIIPEIPDWFCAIIAKLQAKNPDDRYATAIEVADLLERCQSNPHPYDRLQEPLGIPPTVESPGSDARPEHDDAPHGAGRRVRRAVPVIRLVILGGVTLLLVVGSLFLGSRMVDRSDGEKRPKQATAEGAGLERGDADRSAARQVEALAVRLKELNPRFDGVVTPTFTDGAVTGLQFFTDDVGDISPVKAIRSLKTLDIHSQRRGMSRLDDLTALKGLALTELNCAGTRVCDLASLAGMPLVTIDCNFTNVTDLEPIKGMKLTSLKIRGTKIKDLAPLRGMGLTILDFNYNPERDFDVIFSLISLVTINGKPASEFRREEAGLDWAERVRDMPEDAQRAAMTARLKELNPELEEQAEIVYGFKDSELSSLSIRSDHVSNVSFLRAFPSLEIVTLPGRESHGKLADLSPLRRLRLKTLTLTSNPVVDLSPLHGLPLEYLGLQCNPVHDLTPLVDSPVQILDLWATAIDDSSLAALKSMKTLRYLNIGGNGRITDVSPLSLLKLDVLGLNISRVSDISPLRGMPLTNLAISQTRVEDLSPIQGMRLTNFAYKGCPIRDVSVLRGMPLERVACDFDPARDAAVLRSIPTLKTINDKPAAEFWKEFDARQPHPAPN